jgi:hypothetical protein
MRGLWFGPLSSQLFRVVRTVPGRTIASTKSTYLEFVLGEVGMIPADVCGCNVIIRKPAAPVEDNSTRTFHILNEDGLWPGVAIALS